MRRHKSVVAGFAVAAGLLLGTAAQAATWNVASFVPEGSFHTQNLHKFAEEVRAATKGEIDIKVHSANSLVAHPEIRNAVRNGTIPMGEILLSRLANENPLYELDLLPFVVRDYGDARRMWDASREKIEALFARQNLTILYSVPWPNNGLYANKPINRVEDFKGLKFRTYNTVTDRLAQLIGAVPTQVELADIAQAFATGRLDSVITSASAGVSIKAWDFAKRYYDTKTFLGKNVVFVNKRTFDALPESTRNSIRAAAAAAEKRGWEMSAADDSSQPKVLAQNGITVEDPSPELTRSLEQFGKTMFDEWLKRAGADGTAIAAQFRR